MDLVLRASQKSDEMVLQRDYDESAVSFAFYPTFGKTNSHRIEKNNDIVALGEVGLDYYWVKKNRLEKPENIYEMQKYLLDKQLIRQIHKAGHHYTHIDLQNNGLCQAGPVPKRP